MVLQNQLLYWRVRAEPGRQTHFGAIQSLQFANLLKVYPRAEDANAIAYFMPFLAEIQSVL